ncbi:hypothetical protein AB0L40_24640 [Patulibacter sp. NPDC049589]|uniref:hypothetical protein n=1 Tax=Patulibacter sp. NPDC049589 TaxID=3154731 RepID=UPI00344A7434
MTPRTLAVIAALAATPLLAGCGGDDDAARTTTATTAADTATTGRIGSGATAANLVEASNRTTQLGGMRIALKQQIDAGGEGSFSSTAAGEVDPKAQTGSMVLDMSGIPGLPAGAGKQEVRFKGFVSYMRSSLFSSQLPQGKSWIRIDLGKASKSLGIDLGSLGAGGAGSSDPTQALQYLKAATGDIETVGKEDVRGEPTTHYRATIDYARYPSLAKPADRAAAKAGVEQLIKLSGSRTSPMEVWVDGDGRVRRIRQTVGTQLTPGKKATITQDYELYDFGHQVDVQLPPDSEVQDLTDLAGDASKSLTP